MTKLTYFGKVENGKLKLRNRKQFDEDIRHFEGKDVELTFERKRSKRSIPLNRYYWGVVVELIQKAFIDLGHDVEKEDVHEFLKQRFNGKEIINVNSGEILHIGQSTAQLTNTAFMNYMESIKQFSAEFLNVYIPEPNEQLQIDY